MMTPEQRTIYESDDGHWIEPGSPEHLRWRELLAAKEHEDWELDNPYVDCPPPPSIHEFDSSEDWKVALKSWGLANDQREAARELQRQKDLWWDTIRDNPHLDMDELAALMRETFGKPPVAPGELDWLAMRTVARARELQEWNDPNPAALRRARAEVKAEAEMEKFDIESLAIDWQALAEKFAQDDWEDD